MSREGELSREEAELVPEFVKWVSSVSATVSEKY